MLNSFVQKIDIFDALRMLNIKHRTKPNSKGWVSVICPFHNDKNFGNCSVNINSGVISCFKCGESKNIYTLLKDRGVNYQLNTSNTQPIKGKPKVIKQELVYNFIYYSIKPEDYHYLKIRYFTESFCNKFKIVRSFKKYYTDYFTIPIIDEEKGIYEFEFRKLMQYEYLQKYFEIYDKSYEELNIIFNNYCLDNKIHLDSYKLYMNGKRIDDDDLLYLLDKKVKYELNSRVKETIWNINKLNYYKPLYVVEGIGSVCRIYEEISRNITCTFGSQVSKEQIDYLKRFDEVILIPDYDEAGFKMVNTFNQELDNCYVIDIQSDDTNENYIFDILNTNKIKSNEYISKYLLKYNNTLF